MQTSKGAAIHAAHSYSMILIVFDAETRAPEMASGIILSSGRGLLLVTAGHVLQRFLSLGSNGRLQIGARRFTLRDVPSSLIRSFLPDHDVAALNLDTDDLDSIGKEPLPLDEVASERVSEGDLVAFVGYPGYWKEPRGANEYGLGSYEFFGPVRTVEPKQFSLLTDSTYEIQVTTTRSTPVGPTQSLGGLSGAPIFSSAEAPRLVGLIFEGNLWSSADHKLYAVHGTTLIALGSSEAA